MLPHPDRPVLSISTKEDAFQIYCHSVLVMQATEIAIDNSAVGKTRSVRTMNSVRILFEIQSP